MIAGYRSPDTVARVEACKRVLAVHNSLADAMPELSRHGLASSGDALNALFRRARIGPPTNFLAGVLTPVRDFVDVTPETDDGPPTLTGGWHPPDDTFKPERILFIPDAHWPYVDHAAWNLAMRVGRFFQPHKIVVLGDALDCYSVSQHPKSPARYARLADELEDSRPMLDDLDALGAETKHYCMGNHEFRLDRLIQTVPSLFGLRGSVVAELLDLESRGWTWSKYMVEHVIGRLRVCHDYGQAGKYALGRAVTTMDSDVVMGHTHLMDHQERVARNGHTIRGDSFGWLGSVDAIDYMHRGIATMTWTHGVGVGWTQEDGGVRREGVRFVRGEAKVDGQRV